MLPSTSVPSSGLTRRTLLRGAAVAAFAGSAGTVTSALSPRYASAAADALVPARPADDLAETLGVVAVTSSRRGVWGERAMVKSRLGELGVRHIRNRLYVRNRNQVEWIRELGEAGLRFNLVMGDPTLRGGTPEQLVDLAGAEVLSAVASFEGANEWNIKGGAGWIPELRGHQARLYRAAKTNPLTRSVPVLGPSLAQQFPEHFAQLGDLTHVLDRGNIHLYTGGHVPSHRLDDALDAQRAVCRDAPIVITETGWHNARNSTQSHYYTEEDVAGVYAPRQLLEYFQRRVPRAYVYELVDEPTAEPALRDRESHFGLLRNDFSRKPAFTALSNLLSLVSDPGEAVRPDSLAYEVQKAPDDLRQVLVQRRSGEFVLFLWRDVAIWDPKSSTRVPVTETDVTVRLPERSSVRVHRPSVASDPRYVSAAATRLDLPLGADVVALVIEQL